MFDPSVTTLRVWPSDLDFNLHLNNGRYLTLMDIGRFDLCWQSGLLQLAIKKRWLPVVGSAHIVFRKSLQAFQKFEIRTRMLWWDEKWFFLEQTFVSGGDVYARAIIRGVFRCRGRTVPISEIVAALGVESFVPERPDFVDQWSKLEKSIAGLNDYNLAASN